ncbi:protein F [uncultured phage WW-nAnB]|uniref:protein F n=1 Tax=uncultured phage WW-nAnB TaxID=1074044 RepID=UPI00022BE20E|nr:protein F [uncultured phage WW-nAnB]AEP81822.1 protein F [uncultured phage WW-nAnB]
MMEIPSIIKTWVDSDGVTVYTVQYKDGSTCDMTVQQYDYLKSSAQAVFDMDSKASADSQPAVTSVPAEPAQNITESPDLRDGYVPQEEELPFEGSLTAYDDRAADTPALYANLPNVSNSFTAIMDWFGDTFFIERTETVHKSGYTSERYSYSGSTQLIQLPYEEDSTTTSQVLNPQACVSALLVVLVFITTVTWIKNAIWGRMS